MYLHDTITDKTSMVGVMMPSFASKEDIAKADRLEIWASSFEDSGDDFTLFKLMQGDKVISQKRVNGY